MKLLRLVIPISAGIAMAVGAVTALAHGQPAPATPPAPVAIETDLSPVGPPEFTSGAENMHADANGRLWISQDSDFQANVRVFDPATHAYTLYTGLVSPNDAQLGPDGNVWWSLDDTAGGLARLDPASGTVTTWTVPTGPQATALAFDSNNNVWAYDGGSTGLYRFTPNTNQLCHLALPNGAAGSFLTEYNGALWLGDSNNLGLARITLSSPITYTFWPVNANGLLPQPSGVSFAPNGVVWFSDEISNTIGRLETGANRVTLFTPPGGYETQKADYFLGKVWFTGQGSDVGPGEPGGAIGNLDPATATGTTPLVVIPTTTVLSRSCADAGAGITFTAGISTGVSVFSPLALTTTVDAQGVSYAAPSGSQPASLVRFGSNLWLTDEGRNKLVEVVISTTTVYLPLIRR